MSRGSDNLDAETATPRGHLAPSIDQRSPLASPGGVANVKGQMLQAIRSPRGGAQDFAGGRSPRGMPSQSPRLSPRLMKQMAAAVSSPKASPANWKELAKQLQSQLSPRDQPIEQKHEKDPPNQQKAEPLEAKFSVAVPMSDDAAPAPVQGQTVRVTVPQQDSTSNIVSSSPTRHLPASPFAQAAQTSLDRVASMSMAAPRSRTPGSWGSRQYSKAIQDAELEDSDQEGERESIPESLLRLPTAYRMSSRQPTAKLYGAPTVRFLPPMTAQPEEAETAPADSEQAKAKEAEQQVVQLPPTVALQEPGTQLTEAPAEPIQAAQEGPVIQDPKQATSLRMDAGVQPTSQPETTARSSTFLQVLTRPISAATPSQRLKLAAVVLPVVSTMGVALFMSASRIGMSVMPLASQGAASAATAAAAAGAAALAGAVSGIELMGPPAVMSFLNSMQPGWIEGGHLNLAQAMETPTMTAESCAQFAAMPAAQLLCSGFQLNHQPV